jgi:hypothetical protein
MSTPTRKGRIQSFDPSTWWGAVEVSSSAHPVMKFHGTCFLVNAPQRLPEVGEEVLVVFSDDALDKIVAIRAGVRTERRTTDSDSNLQVIS